MAEVWSCGGGVQSTAIAALIVRGDLPKPDVAVIADTGREASETWRYYDAVLRPHLETVGVELVRLPHSFEGAGWNTVDLFGGEDRRTALMPMFTDKNGSMGQVAKYCSNEWKSRPVDRYIRSLGLTAGHIWIGFSIDEMHRMRFADPKAKWNQTYPLIDRRMTRGDCVALVERQGWPTPPRSSCWMCPYRSDDEWRHLKATDPEDFERAVEVEREVQAVDDQLYLHRSGTALASVDFSQDTGDLFADQCGSGMCFT
jgi:hypothetical protein